MKFKNMLLFAMLFVTSFLGTNIFGSDELTATDKLTAILNEKEEEWRIADKMRLNVVEAMNLSWRLRDSLRSLCYTLDLSKYNVDCGEFKLSLFGMGALLNSENLRLIDEQGRLKDEINALKDKIMSMNEQDQLKDEIDAIKDEIMSK